MSFMTILLKLYLLSNCCVTTTATVYPEIPYFVVDSPVKAMAPRRRVGVINPDVQPNYFIPFTTLIDEENDTSEFWQETEILALVRDIENKIDYEKCEQNKDEVRALHFPPIRTIRPICRNNTDQVSCPLCPSFSNLTECELFRDSCSERRVNPSEYRTYCDDKYGKWRAKFIAADYSQCRCCDECVFYRELHESCVQDEYALVIEEFLPVTTIDFRAGCNPYEGHPQQQKRALQCEIKLRKCVPVTASLTNETKYLRRSFEPPIDGSQCPTSCDDYECVDGSLKENDCPPGAFLPDKTMCNCCGICRIYQQSDHNCTDYRTVDVVDGTEELVAEEDVQEAGCVDGPVCSQRSCQDLHVARRRNKDNELPREPCKQVMKYFMKKYGKDGVLHNEAPQCTPLWLYAPVQCRKFFCYCSLEDGTFLKGYRVPRVNVSNMNCDCAREKYRTESEIECDKYGNYKDVTFIQHSDSWNVTEGHVWLKRAQFIKKARDRRRKIPRRTTRRRSTSRMNKTYLPITLLSLYVSIIAYFYPTTLG